ncbi:MAG: hypothetical protein R3228_05035 [Halioglobus sp.]|nr:hypothetical protein [Halioglobus sp.]
MISSLCYLIFSLLLFTVTGLSTDNARELGFESPDHLLGMVLLMCLLPTWLIACMFVTQRNSYKLARALDPDLASRVAAVPSKYLWIGVLGGFIYAIAFNVPMTHFGLVLDGNGQMIGIFIGQALVWIFVGWMLAVRLYVGNQFHNFGKYVAIKTFEQSGLESFARVGLLDVAIIVGCLAISAVQSIDAQFRLENYLTAFIVAIPATLALLIRPMWSVHVRLLQRKRELLAEVTMQIQQAPESTDLESIVALELLLERRDRVKALNTWPLDFSIWSRLLFYGLIPPLAWIAAALVEVLVERALT